MASASTNGTSSIGFAFAGKTESVNIPKPRDTNFWTGKHTFAAVAARPVPSGKQHSALPNPPNSISPTLPPQGFKSHVAAGPPTPPAAATPESDIDLQDAVEHAQAQDKTQHGLVTSRGSLTDIDAAGAITPAMLARHHLPNILLEHGPLAIRHVMGYLTTSVPGFSGIPPAKARRLVVGALEGYSSGRESETADSDVTFEKVGWGRWDARRQGQPTRQTRSCGLRLGRHPSPKFQMGLEIPYSGSRHNRSRDMCTRMGADQDSEMEYDTPPEDISMLEQEADRMSLDGANSCSSSDGPDNDPMLEDGLDDVTDEEDWASIGAAALRQGSFPIKSGGSRPQLDRSRSSYLDPMNRGWGGGPPLPRSWKSHRRRDDDVDISNGGDPEQRAAVEALLKLASV